MIWVKRLWLPMNLSIRRKIFCKHPVIAIEFIVYPLQKWR